jgi:alkanesulfonate monooxygenase SsuD/methylene tetrahydromethanopterin reductase-like flavin-dependent oxidoreductase (luciferase family)
LWTGKSVTYRGQFYQLEEVTLALRPVSAAYPPIWVGASSERAVRTLAGVSDALVYSAHLSVSDLVHLQEHYLDERHKLGVGPPSDTAVLRNVFVGRDRETAAAACLPFVGASYEQYGDAGLFREVIAKAGSDPGRIADALGERLVVGSADDVAAELKRIVKRLRATKVVVRMQWLGMPSSLVEDSIIRFGRDVIPQLA